MNPEIRAYYAVVNIIDWYISLTDKKEDTFDKVIALLEQIELESDINPADVGDANDCGSCESWEDVIDGFQHLTETGERIPV